MKKLTVEPDFLVGRTLAKGLVNKETGEVVANANDEVTEAALKKILDADIEEVKTLYTNDLDQGPYISQTLRVDETTDALNAQVAIYRMMRPGEPPTEDAVKTLFNGLFFSEDRYDLSAVGRMKFNRRVGRDELTGADDAVERRHRRGDQDPGRAAQRPRRDRRHRPPRQPPRAFRGRARGEPVPLGPGARRARGARAPLAGREREPDAARPDQREAGIGGDQGVLRLAPAVAVHGPDQPALRDHAQAPHLRAGPGRPHARARRLRGARRAPDPLRPRLPDRDPGRPEHRPHQLAGALRAHQRLRLHRDAVSPREGRQGHQGHRVPVGDRGRQVRDRPGERRARPRRQVRRRAGLLPPPQRVHALRPGQDRVHRRGALRRSCRWPLR